ncbi:hypothetical protein [Flavivirga eckloniae]|uniref:Uncharacterized protein n=1 Tax=Flavivirga eckloniae TaxID=1803846 RepID=A0A2K9PVA0_9FLAO|nr:hypothetical protein [Flavivirga eckloniae]AUP80981.1 hypothetical protein C1H87_20605 [Flavivirga eckloniae]
MKVRWAKQEELTEKVRDFSKMFQSDSELLIENVKTTYRVLRVNDNLFFPVTINDEEWDNSFVCSPYTAYANYSKDEIKWKIKNRIVKKLLLILLNVIAKWLRKGALNKNIHVNNFLLSTNPFPEWDGREIEAITAFIVSEYPEHAIIFRSLNIYQHSKLIDVLKASSYDAIGSRQVYIFDLSKEAWLKHRNNKHDNRLIRKSGLRLIDHDKMKEYLPQALELYRKLYLVKYSKFNPQFTLKYIQECHEKELVKFQGYIDEHDSLKAFSGVFTIENTITSPLVGYDTDMPQKDGLYIHAAQLAILEKFETGLLLNLSSGASGFKRMRGGQPSIEYSLLYLKHLPRKRRLRWQALKVLSNKIGVPIIKKYKL